MVVGDSAVRPIAEIPKVVLAETLDTVTGVLAIEIGGVWHWLLWDSKRRHPLPARFLGAVRKAMLPTPPRRFDSPVFVAEVVRLSLNPPTCSLQTRRNSDEFRYAGGVILA
jgi:hypothetical protein